jgi:hypothetical protein
MNGKLKYHSKKKKLEPKQEYNRPIIHLSNMMIDRTGLSLAQHTRRWVWHWLVNTLHHGGDRLAD